MLTKSASLVRLALNWHNKINCQIRSVRYGQKKNSYQLEVIFYPGNDTYPDDIFP